MGGWGGRYPTARPVEVPDGLKNRAFTYFSGLNALHRAVFSPLEVEIGRSEPPIARSEGLKGDSKVLFTLINRLKGR